ncbi:transforming growth factor beta regulator 1 [Rhizophlyctis rosea]|nr:transforming growth factor beta regulator 1 [Rhizophlyctis rosea]
MAPTEEKYKLLKRKVDTDFDIRCSIGQNLTCVCRSHTQLKEVLEDNDRLNTRLKKSKVKLGSLRREKDLLLDRLTKYEMPDSSDEDTDSLSSSGSDSDASSVSSDDGHSAKYGSRQQGDHPARWTQYDERYHGSGLSTPQSAMEVKSQGSKRSTGKKPVTKRAPVVTKTRKIQQVPMDADGKPILPVQIGIITVHALGEIVYDRKTFHNERYIYPVGYRASRPYQSMVNPEATTNYMCSVTDGGEGPRFHVVPEDSPENGIVANTATGAWTNIIKAANAIRKRDHSNSASGPDYFGFSHPTIAAIIQALPNAEKCGNYVWQNYEVIKGRGTKRVNRHLGGGGTPTPGNMTPNSHTQKNDAAGGGGGTSSTGSPTDKLDLPSENVGDGQSDMQVDQWENGSVVDEESVGGSRYTSPMDGEDGEEGGRGVDRGQRHGEEEDEEMFEEDD